MKKIFENWNKYLKEQREFWGYNISPEQKIALTLKPITKAYVVKQPKIEGIEGQGHHPKYRVEKHGNEQLRITKPRGLWYACGSGWIDYLETETDRRVEEGNNYMYELDIDYSKMYRVKDSLSLEREYGFYAYENDGRGGGRRFVGTYINWAKMQEDGYTGVEICPYEKPEGASYAWDNNKHLWFWEWDIPSGCIWDPKALKGYKLLATQPGTPGKGYTHKRPPRKGEPGYDAEYGSPDYVDIRDWPRERGPLTQQIPGLEKDK